MPSNPRCRALALPLVLLAASAFAGEASAATYSWASATSGNWRDNTRWTPNTGFPGSGGSTADSATLPNLAGGYAVTLGGGITINNFTWGDFEAQLNLLGTAALGDASLAINGATSGFSGVLTLDSTGGAFASSLTLAPGRTLNILPTGQVHILAGSRGGRVIAADSILNEGSIFVETDATVGRAGVGSLQNGLSSLGSVQVAPNATLTTNRYVQEGTATTLLAGTIDALSTVAPIEINGGRVLGDGTFADSVTVAGARLRPTGSGPSGFEGTGTIDVTGDVTFGDDSVLTIALGPGGASSALAITEDFLLPGVDTALELSGGELGQIYTIVTYGGTREGTFDLATPGYFVDYSVPGQVRVIIPEPAGGIMAACGATILLAGARRRRPGSL